MSQHSSDLPAPVAVFTDPIVQLAALCPICALASMNPTAALSALSPVLRMYNPAINPLAALLAFSMTPTMVSANIHAQISARMAGLLLVKAGLTMLVRQ